MTQKQSIIQRVVQKISVRKTVTSVRARSDRLREELAEAESVEQLIEGLFMAYDELLEDMDKANQSMQRATTKMKNTVKERKAQLEALLSEE